VSDRSGVGVVELALLDALDSLGARPDRGFRQCERVLAMVEDASAVPRGYGYEVLVDTARDWLTQVPLIDGQGNFGGQGNDPAAAPRYTEARLSPGGQLALAAERAELAPVPIGLINGNTHRGGLRPPLRPQGIIDAIRLVLRQPDVVSRELLDTVGPPDFITGCTVTGDMSAFYAGDLMELRLESRVSITDEASLPEPSGLGITVHFGPRRRSAKPPRNGTILLIDSFPPYANPSETTASIARRASPRDWDDEYPELRYATRLQLRNVRDESRAGKILVACFPEDNADPEHVRDQLLNVYGVWIGVTVRLRQPLATMIRQWVARNRHEDLLASLDALEEAIAARDPYSGG
jgi:DNA gyrase/topoisomerase IV subunit A